MQPALLEKCSYTMAVRGLLVERSVTVSRMNTFAVANEMGRGVVSVAVVAAFANSSAASSPGMPLWPGTQIRVAGLPLCVVAGE